MAGTGKAATAAETGKGRPRARHDQTYKAVYKLVHALQHLVHGFLPDVIEGVEEWLEHFDFERAELMSTEQITPDLARRYIDMLWKVPIVKGRMRGRRGSPTR